LEYSNQLYELAVKKEDHQWVATAYHLLGRLYFSLGEIQTADSVYQVAVNYESNRQPPYADAHVWQLVNYGNFNKWLGQYRKALNLFKEGLGIAMKASAKQMQTDCLVNAGSMYLFMGDYDSALVYLEPAKLLAYSIGDTSSLQTVSNNIANIYEAEGKYEEALEELKITETYSRSNDDFAYLYGTRGTIYYYLGKMDKAVEDMNKSKEFFRKDGSELEVGMVLNSLGEFFNDHGDTDEARKNFKAAEEIFKKLGNDDFLSGVLINTADLFYEAGDLDSSQYYYQYALELADKVQNYNHLGMAYHSLSNLEKEKGNLQAALDLIDKSIGIYEQIGDKRLMAEGYIALSDINLQLKRYPDAKRNADRALEIAGEVSNIRTQIDAYNQYIHSTALSAGIPSLYEYHQKQFELQDSLRSQDNFNAVEELSVQYDLKEKQDSIRIQSFQIENQKEVNEKITIINEQRGWLLWMAGIGGSILLALAIALWINRNKVKAKNRENELLLGEIHHRVKNNLQVISSLLSLQEKSLNDESAKKAILEGKERVKSMGLIHKMLYQNDNYSGIEMRDYIENLMDGLLESFGIVKGDIIISTDVDNLKLDVDSAIPVGLMINELVINSLKYAFDQTESPQMKLKFQALNDELILEVSDNGSGKLKDIESSNSFGTKLIRSLVRQLNGELKVSEENGIHYSIKIKDYKLV
jgi:two-component sensor histidine kinase/Tfp pilus assembly protein PilF